MQAVKKCPDDYAGEEQDTNVHPAVSGGRDPQHENDREQGSCEGSRAGSAQESEAARPIARARTAPVAAPPEIPKM